MKGTIIILSFVLIVVASACAVIEVRDGRDNNGSGNTSTGANNSNTNNSEDIDEDIYDDAIIQLRRYGAFTLPEMAIQVLTVEEDKVTYRLYSSNNNLTNEFVKPIDRDTYNDLISMFKENEFIDMEQLYGPKEGDPIVTDVGTAEFSIIGEDATKTVKVDPYYQDYMPVGLKEIDARLIQLIEFAMNTTRSEAEDIAENFIKNAPTYKYDGSDLRFVSYTVRESYPEQHVLVYRFTSSHAGYGDRAGRVSAEVITPHVIEVVVSGNKVISAVIDDKWDELRGRAMTEESDNRVKITFQPMQCQESIWQKWYKEGNIKFVKAPTDIELATIYYSEEHNINVEDLRRVASNETVCQACDVCPTSYYYTATVSENDADKLRELGWN